VKRRLTLAQSVSRKPPGPEGKRYGYPNATILGLGWSVVRWSRLGVVRSAFRQWVAAETVDDDAGEQHVVAAHGDGDQTYLGWGPST
jgi:hypothetical protein